MQQSSYALFMLLLNNAQCTHTNTYPCYHCYIRMQWYTKTIYSICIHLFRIRRTRSFAYFALKERSGELHVGVCVCVRALLSCFCFCMHKIFSNTSVRVRMFRATVYTYSFYQPKWQQRTRHILRTYFRMHIVHMWNVHCRSQRYKRIVYGWRYVVDWNQFKL